MNMVAISSEIYSSEQMINSRKYYAKYYFVPTLCAIKLFKKMFQMRPIACIPAKEASISTVVLLFVFVSPTINPSLG
jgi:hypothetical protein